MISFIHYVFGIVYKKSLPYLKSQIFCYYFSQRFIIFKFYICVCDPFCYFLYMFLYMCLCVCIYIYMYKSYLIHISKLYILFILHFIWIIYFIIDNIFSILYRFIFETVKYQLTTCVYLLLHYSVLLTCQF